jgi:transcriptional regulator with XRE-family HTH domain
VAIDTAYARKMGAVLKYYRLRSNLALNYVARSLGYRHPNSLARIEDGRSAIQVHDLLPIAALYQVDVRTLLALEIPSDAVPASDERCGFRSTGGRRCIHVWAHDSRHEFLRAEKDEETS